ncbi:ABC transporter permease DevC [Lentilitoribacter sp. EG35]|jgi:putative ABC transport system permease protein|uniref:ABC transporter permease DevC n=1 Tax=Lentilitoribacter sp. EG35 TaxID=3234192 RepID=UPI003460DA05
MSHLLKLIFGRMPIGWLQLSHSKAKLAAAVAGVAFANILVFVQLGILGALNGASVAPYALFNSDIMISSEDTNTLTDGSNLSRQRMFQALGVAGVSDATPLYIATLEWQQPDGGSSNLQSFGIDPDATPFLSAEISEKLDLLRLPNTLLIDESTRGASQDQFNDVSRAKPLDFELNGTAVRAVDLIKVGGGFTADGTLFTSDQTFLSLFPKRIAGAPNHILVKVADGISIDVVVERLRKVLPGDSVIVRSVEDAAAADLKYQTTERPTGVIFGFGVLIGVLVGIVIVYQVLATDVSDHLKEYATFKAMGYDHSFFLGIVFEEALILAVFGFIPGVILASLLYLGLSNATGLPVEMGLARAVMVFFGTLIACSISGAIATRRLAGADPADLF